MKVRPSTSSNIPSTLQLLPGQSFYIGKTTLSLVPEEHSDLPIYSSDLPDSNFESYNHQVSQLSTTQRTARVGSAIMETPTPPRDHGSEVFTPILENVTGQAISGRKDIKTRSESPLKREVMRTMRAAGDHGHSRPPPESRKGDKHIADAAINGPDRSSSQPEVKTEDEDIANATAPRPHGQGVMDPEDTEIVGVAFESDKLEKSELLSSLKTRVHPEDEHGNSDRAPITEKSKPLLSPALRALSAEEPGDLSLPPILAGSKSKSSTIARMQPEKGPEASDQSPILQGTPGSSPQVDDDLDDTPVRKKVKTKAVSSKALIEESQDSLLNEVISVKRRIHAPTDRSVSANLASSDVATPLINTESHSPSADQPKQRSPTSSTESKHLSVVIDSDSRPHAASQRRSESSFKSSGRTPLSHQNMTSASPSDSVAVDSSIRSNRSKARDEYNGSSDAGIRIVFASSSSAGDSKPVQKFLSGKGVKKVQSVHDCTVLCVGKEFKKTSKLILAVLLGKDIITDSWVTDSIKGNHLLSVVTYMPRDFKKEADWGFTLDEAIGRGKRGLKVLEDQTIAFTSSVKKELGKSGFDELKEIVKYAGGVSSALPKKTPEETSSTLVIATHDSPEVAQLQKLGWRVYVRDIISLSILRGKLDLESDEFLLTEQKKESRKRKR